MSMNSKLACGNNFQAVVPDQRSATCPDSTAPYKTCRGFGPTCGKWLAAIRAPAHDLLELAYTSAGSFLFLWQLCTPSWRNSHFIINTDYIITYPNIGSSIYQNVIQNAGQTEQCPCIISKIKKPLSLLDNGGAITDPSDLRNGTATVDTHTHTHVNW